MMLLNIKCSQNGPTLSSYIILFNIKYFSKFSTHFCLTPNLFFVEDISMKNFIKEKMITKINDKLKDFI